MNIRKQNRMKICAHENIKVCNANGGCVERMVMVV